MPRSGRAPIERLESRIFFSQTIYVDNNNPSAGPASDGTSWATAFTGIKQALASAVSGDEIRVADGTYIHYNEGSPFSYELKAGVTLRGGYAGLGAADPNARDFAATPSIISGGGIARMIKCTVQGAALDGFTFKDGFINGSGYTDQASGGAIYLEGGSLAVSDCRFINNYANGAGGSIYGGYSQLSVTGSTFENGRTNGSGGAIYVGHTGSSLAIADCEFRNNTSDGFAAAVYTYAMNSALTIDRSTFTKNVSRIDGGAIFTQGAPGALINDSTFTDNAGQYGGAVCAWGSTPLTINRCSFDGNTTEREYVTDRGGAVYAGGVTEINDSTFTANRSGDGGALYGGKMTLRRCTFSNNRANYGFGGAVFGGAGTFEDLTFADNFSVYHGGGLYLKSGTMVAALAQITRCTFIRNQSNPNVNVGGGIYSDGPSLMLNACQFNGNAGAHGGGLYAYSSFSGATLEIVNTAFVGNAAWPLNGGDGAAVFKGGFTGGSRIVNSTFVANTGERGAAVYNYSNPLTVANSIIWNNSATLGTVLQSNTGVITVNNSDVQGGYAGTGNINADPLFVRSPAPGTDNTWGTADDDYGDLRLQYGSPGIDAGSNASVPPSVATDLAGNPRFFDFPGVKDPGNIVDIGAYEANLHLPMLRVPSGQTLTLPAGRRTFQIDRLELGENATLDIRDNAIVVEYAEGQPSPANDIEQLVRSGFNSGQWNGPGITSSSAAADSNFHVGVAENSELSAPFGTAQGGELFGTADVDDTRVLIRFTHRVDLNLDGVVNETDSILFSTHFEIGSTANWSTGDLNGDGIHSDDDAILFGTFYDSSLQPI